MGAPHPPTISRSSALYEFLDGLRDQVPLLFGVAPFGMIFGALAIDAGIPPLEAQGFSLFVFAGSAQLIAAGMIANAVPPVIIVLTILVVNLRHMLYSASLSPHIQRLTPRWRIILSWLLTDEAFAVASLRYRRGNTAQAHWYTLGTGLALWVTWQVSTGIGILLGAHIPGSWSLDFALPLTFMALIATALTNQSDWAAALSAGFMAVALVGLPYKMGLLLASIVGITAGVVVEISTPNKKAMTE